MMKGSFNLTASVPTRLYTRLRTHRAEYLWACLTIYKLHPDELSFNIDGWVKQACSYGRKENLRLGRYS